MKSFKVLLIFCVASLALPMAAMAGRPVRSLHDLPARWEGVAGDLVVRTAASLTIDRVIKVTRADGESDLNATYDVDASLVLGERTVGVNQVKLFSYGVSDNTLEAFLQLNDELVPVVQVSIHYDEASDTYTLSEIQNNGTRRFVLKAPARK